MGDLHRTEGGEIMIRLEDNRVEILQVQQELNRCKTKGPHYRDLSKRLRKLKNERAEALKYLKEAGKI